MGFRRFLENWDGVGTGATVADELEAGRRLLARIKVVMKDQYAKPWVRQYLGRVKDFYPAVEGRHPDIGERHVFFDPNGPGAAYTRGYDVNIGRFAFADRGSSGSLGKTFIHEVEHLFDQKMTNSRGEFTPRLRQMLREVPTEPCPELYSLLGRHKLDHAEYWVDHFFELKTGHALTPGEREFAIQALLKRANEIYSSMKAGE